MKARVRVWAFGILAAAALWGISGCEQSTEAPAIEYPSPYLARTSPQNLLANLRLAYVNRDLAAYDSLLATDFAFYFSEEDQAIAEKLTRSEELTVHGNICSSTHVESIALSFTLGDLTLDTDQPDLAHPGQFLWTLTATNVDLRLQVIQDGEMTTYEMQDGVEQFWFREESWTDAHGHKIWTIVKWRELTDLIPDGAARTMAVELTSWGQLKDLYR